MRQVLTVFCQPLVWAENRSSKCEHKEKPKVYNNSSFTEIWVFGQDSVCASVLEELSMKRFDSRYQEASQPLFPSLGLRSSSAVICSISESYKVSSHWDLYENKQSSGEAAALTSRKKTESDQKHIEAERRVTVAWYDGRRKGFMNGNPRLQITD